MTLQTITALTGHSSPPGAILKESVKAAAASLFFPHYFSAELANSPQQREACFRLRHQVYCEELNFEPLKPNGLETDCFDNRAWHACISHTQKQQLAGTVRVITSASRTELLPLEQNFGALITNPVLSPQNFDRQHICEISRLAVPANIRRNQPCDDDMRSTEQQCCRQVAVALYLIATQLCLQTNRHHSFVMIEPALARILRRIGIHFIQIGDTVDYNGLRAPYYLDMRTTKVTLTAEYLQLRSTLAQQLNASTAQQYIA